MEEKENETLMRDVVKGSKQLLHMKEEETPGHF